MEDRGRYETNGLGDARSSKMSSIPEISVIIPAFKGASLLRARSIPSALSQTHRNFECLVIDGGSPDETEVIVKTFSKEDARVHYIQKQNGGPASARNVGIKESRGNFIAFLDQDDEYFPEYLRVGIDKLAKLPEEIEALTCGVIFVDENGRKSYSLQSLEPYWMLPIGSG